MSMIYLELKWNPIPKTTNKLNKKFNNNNIKKMTESVQKEKFLVELQKKSEPKEEMKNSSKGSKHQTGT